jgi:tetratricopeptide (TPR) repeat protein
MRGSSFAAAVFCAVMALGGASPSSAGTASPQNEAGEQRETVHRGLDLLMNGDVGQALALFKQIQEQSPEDPLGYLLAADATWWKIYLTTADLVDPDVFDVVYSKSSPDDPSFDNLVDTAIHKATSQIPSGRDLARNELYEGLAYALRARFEGLRDHDLAVARASKKMRALLLAASRADPGLVDADAGLGLYNYFVDTLPAFVKMLRFFIGLPGGSRELGLRQLRHAADQGDLVRAEAKFYLAKDFSRASERQYETSLQLFQELSREYPRNLLWKLLIGSLEVRLGRGPDGEAIYGEVLAQPARGDSEIEQALHREAEKALKRLHPEQKTAATQN